MIVNKIVLIVNLYKNQYQYDSKKKEWNMSIQYEIYYEICYVNSIACARYSRHCDGFSLCPHKKTRCVILMTLYLGLEIRALVIVMSTTFMSG